MNTAEISLGYVQITNLVASTALTIPSGTRLALIQAEGQDVRWRDDGTAPTAAIGMKLPSGAELRYTAAQLPRLRFIETLPSAKLNITFYG